MSKPQRAQRKTLTYAQLEGRGKPQRAQRKTLTYSQLEGRGDAAGVMEGRGIFKKLGKLIKKGVRKIGKFLKKKKVLSKGLKIGSAVLGILPGVPLKATSLGLSVASRLAAQKGFGVPAKVKSLSRNQVEALLRGLGTLMSSGGVSLASARSLFPTIKNITATQMKALAAFRGRHMSGGGVSLAGGRATGLSMSGMGFSGMGVKLAGQGVSLAGGRSALLRRKTSAQIPGRGTFGKSQQKGKGVSLAGGRAVRLPSGRVQIAPPGFILKKKIKRRLTRRV